MNGSKRFSSVLFICYALGFLLSFAYAFLSYRGGTVLGPFAFSYQMNEALITFFENAIIIQVSAMLVAFSLFSQSGEERSSPHAGPVQFLAAAKPALATVIAITLLFTLGFFFVQPGLYSTRYTIERDSLVYNDSVAEASAAIKAQDYQKAVDAYARALDILPSDESLENLKSVAADKASKGNAAAKAAKLPAEPRARAGDPNDSLTALQYYEKAQDFFGKKDYYSAHYYAALSAQIDPRRKDAAQLAQKALDYINKLAASETEATKRAFAEKKKAAYDMLRQGDVFGAYNEFSWMKDDLQARKAQDKDVDTFLAQARDAIDKVAFPEAEALKARSGEGETNVVFVNSRDKERIEFIKAGRILSFEGKYYFYDLEAMQIEYTGIVTYQLKAKYAKLSHGQLLFIYTIPGPALADGKASLQYREAQYLKGKRNADWRNRIELGLRPEELFTVARAQNDLQSLNFSALVTIGEAFSKSGFETEPLSVEIIKRLLSPLSFLVLSMLALALGWRFRLRRLDKLPWYLLLFIPIFPVVVSYAVSLWLFLNMLVSTFLVLAVGAGFAITLFILIQAGLMALSLFYLAGQHGE